MKWEKLMKDINEMPACPIATVLELIGNKWKVFIIRDLLSGTKRFGELKKATGASQKSLAANLREMEDDGIVERKVFPEVPPRVDYTLTDVGYSLASVLDAMADWGEGYKQFLKLVEKQNKKTLSQKD